MVLLQALFHMKVFSWESDKGSVDNTLNLLILRAPCHSLHSLGKALSQHGGFLMIRAHCYHYHLPWGNKGKDLIAVAKKDLSLSAKSTKCSMPHAKTKQKDPCSSIQLVTAVHGSQTEGSPVATPPRLCILGEWSGNAVRPLAFPVASSSLTWRTRGA